MRKHFGVLILFMVLMILRFMFISSESGIEKTEEDLLLKVNIGMEKVNIEYVEYIGIDRSTLIGLLIFAGLFFLYC
jgi:hypothetical protein